jgi:hypothetical protein
MDEKLARPHRSSGSLHQDPDFCDWPGDHKYDIRNLSRLLEREPGTAFNLQNLMPKMLEMLDQCPTDNTGCTDDRNDHGSRLPWMVWFCYGSGNTELQT